MIWAVVPAAGSGARFGGQVPKQYRPLAGMPLLVHSLNRVLAHPAVDAAMVVLAADDRQWMNLGCAFSKPVQTCIGGSDRAASVLAGLRALPPSVDAGTLVLVHDAARPCVQLADIDRLIGVGRDAACGALLAAPVRDTLKRDDGGGFVAATVARDALWRALTPQAFRRGLLTRALEQAVADGVAVTDEAMAVERLGLHPRLVEGHEDNIKVTVASDLALAEHLLAAQARQGSP